MHFDGVFAWSYLIEKGAVVAPTMPDGRVPANPVVRSKTFPVHCVQICSLIVILWSSGLLNQLGKLGGGTEQ